MRNTLRAWFICERREGRNFHAKYSAAKSLFCYVFSGVSLNDAILLGMFMSFVESGIVHLTGAILGVTFI